MYNLQSKRVGPVGAGGGCGVGKTNDDCCDNCTMFAVLALDAAAAAAKDCASACCASNICTCACCCACEIIGAMDDVDDICVPETDADDEDDGEGNTMDVVEGASHPALLRFFAVPSVPSFASIIYILSAYSYIDEKKKTVEKSLFSFFAFVAVFELAMMDQLQTLIGRTVYVTNRLKKTLQTVK